MSCFSRLCFKEDEDKTMEITRNNHRINRKNYIDSKSNNQNTNNLKDYEIDQKINSKRMPPVNFQNYHNPYFYQGVNNLPYDFGTYDSNFNPMDMSNTNIKNEFNSMTPKSMNNFFQMTHGNQNCNMYGMNMSQNPYYNYSNRLNPNFESYNQLNDSKFLNNPYIEEYLKTQKNKSKEEQYKEYLEFLKTKNIAETEETTINIYKKVKNCDESSNNTSKFYIKLSELTKIEDSIKCDESIKNIEKRIEKPRKIDKHEKSKANNKELINNTNKNTNNLAKSRNKNPESIKGADIQYKNEKVKNNDIQQSKNFEIKSDSDNQSVKNQNKHINNKDNKTKEKIKRENNSNNQNKKVKNDKTEKF